MTRISWGSSSEKYQSGVDRGVLYPSNGEAIPWDGLISVDINRSSAKSEEVYIDGKKLLDIPGQSVTEAKLSAYTYPDEFLKYDGYGEVNTGVLVDGQPIRDVFSLAYRSMVNGGEYYRYHFLYNLIAIPDETSYDTIDDDISAVEFSWELKSTPKEFTSVDGRKLYSSHLIIDSRLLSGYDALAYSLEEAMYGGETTNGSIAAIDSYISKLSGANSQFTLFSARDGEWVVVGPDEKTTNTDGIWSADDPDSVIYPDGSFDFAVEG